MIKTLVISPIYPFPQRCGLSLRIFDLCRYISKTSELHLFTFSKTPDEIPYQSQAQAIFKKITIVGDEGSPLEKTSSFQKIRQKLFPPHFDDKIYFSDSLLQMLRNLHKTENYHVCMIITPFLARALNAFPDSVFKIVDTIDIFYQRHKEFSKIGYPSVLSQFRDLKREIDFYKSANLVIGISLEDFEFLRSYGIKTIYVPVSFKTRPLPEKKTIDSNILYPAGKGITNVDAIKHFINNIFPIVKKYRPESKFIIVNPDNQIKNTYSHVKDIILLPELDDITDAYMIADLVAIPLRAGSGIKIKVLESFSFGRATIISQTAAQGIYLNEYPQKVISSSTVEFADEIINVFNDKNYKHALIKAGLQIIENHYNPENVYGELNQILLSL